MDRYSNIELLLKIENYPHHLLYKDNGSKLCIIKCSNHLVTESVANESECVAIFVRSVRRDVWGTLKKKSTRIESIIFFPVRILFIQISLVWCKGYNCNHDSIQNSKVTGLLFITAVWLTCVNINSSMILIWCAMQRHFKRRFEWELLASVYKQKFC